MRKWYRLLLNGTIDDMTNELRPVVLVVDNEESVRTLLIMAFDRHFDVLAAAGVEEARQVLRERQVSVVVSDIYMPGECGLTLGKHIQAHHPGVPIVYLSGLGDPAMVEQAAALGTCVIPKPPSLRDLVAVVGRLAHQG